MWLELNLKPPMISLRYNFQTNALSSWDWTYRPKRYEYIKKDAVNSSNIQKDFKNPMNGSRKN